MLIDLRAAPDAADVGGKAARLGWLMAGGYRVPAGAALPFRHALGLDRSDDVVDLRRALGGHARPRPLLCGALVGQRGGPG